MKCGMAKNKNKTDSNDSTPKDVELVVPASLANTEEYRQLQKLVEEQKKKTEEMLRDLVAQLSKDTKKKFKSYQQLVKFVLKNKRSKKKKA